MWQWQIPTNQQILLDQTLKRSSIIALYRLEAEHLLWLLWICFKIELLLVSNECLNATSVLLIQKRPMIFVLHLVLGQRLKWMTHSKSVVSYGQFSNPIRTATKMCSSLNCQAVTRSYRLNGETFYYARQGFTDIDGFIFSYAA